MTTNLPQTKFKLIAMRLLIILFIIPLISYGQPEIKKQYYNNGNILSEVHYNNEKRDGLCNYYWENGQLMSGGSYKNGKMIGSWKSYYENGQLKSHGAYKYTESGAYSRKDGVWKYYYDNGQLESESIIKDGVEELKFYDKQGNLIPMGDGC